MTSERAPTPSGTPTPLPAAETDVVSAPLAALAAGLGGACRPGRDMPVLEVPRERWREAAQRLRDEPALRFDFCVAVTATDETPEVPRFRVVAILHSHARNARVRLRCAAAEGEAVPSLVPVWPGANWMEREVFDMFGIPFDGHPDLRRILMPERYGWHPLRKDFPLEGIEPDRLYREWERDRVAKRGTGA